MKRPWAMVLVCVLLATVTFAVYWPVRHHEFLNYDDPDYVTENRRVQAGVTKAGIVWAFTELHGERTYWHPLTWLSHMLDCQWFGLNAAAHHVVNVGFHVVNAVLLFLLLHCLTGAVWRSAAVAALFALHPLQVDTVAWVTERKNLLSTLFFLLTLWAYAHHARSTEGTRRKALDGNQPQNSDPNSSLGFLTSRAYWLALLFFILGLMSKPMVVTLPCVLLLLDYWPLRRFHLPILKPRFPTVTRLFWEKLPFFTLAGVVSAVTVMAHQRLGVVSSHEQTPVALRVANAVMSYARYLQKTIWPDNLAVFYPYPASWPKEQVAAAAALLLAVSVGVWWQRRSRAAMLVGWCWFLGTLVPTIGLVQVGAQASADRFMYVPLIGLCFAGVWGLGEVMVRFQRGRFLTTVTAVALLTLTAVTSRFQLRHWQDSISLFEHTLKVTEDNPTARNNLGAALAAKGRFSEAITHFQVVLHFDPDSSIAHCNLGTALEHLGQTADALDHYRIALKLDPQNAAAHFNIANSLANSGQFDEAVLQYQDALRLQPDYPSAHNNLAIALNRLGQTDDALAHVREALKLNPYHSEAWNNLGGLYAERGDEKRALECYQSAVRLSPTLARAHYNLGNSLARLGDTNGALASLNRAVELDPVYLEARYQLADLHASLGDLDRAAYHFAKVDSLNPGQLEAWNRLGKAMVKLGKFSVATNCFHRALRINPDTVEPRVNLANVLAKLGQLAAANAQCREAVRRAPQDARAHHALGRILHQQGEAAEAATHLRAAIEFQPDWPEALNDAAWMLATAPAADLRDGREAVRLASRANELTRQSRPNMLGTLAAAYATAGQFSEAVANAERAIALAQKAGLQPLADQTRARLRLYEAGKPCIEDSNVNEP